MLFLQMTKHQPQMLFVQKTIYIYIHVYTGNGTGQPANSVLHPVLRFSSGKAGTSSELMQTVMLNVLPHTQLTITLCTQCDQQVHSTAVRQLLPSMVLTTGQRLSLGRG